MIKTDDVDTSQLYTGTFTHTNKELALQSVAIPLRMEYKINENEYHYNDLRYPLLDLDNPNSSVFSLQLFKEKNRLNMKPFEPKFESLGSVLASIWERIKGI
mgnify:CR=1 FL=1